MSEMSRRNFLGAAAALAVAAPAVASAEEYDSHYDFMAANAPAVSFAASTFGPAGKDVDLLSLEEVDAKRKEIIASKTEYVCADGTVIPEVYVKLRTLINTIGMGNGNEVHDGAFGEIMYLFSEEDAAHVLEMPVGVMFTATEYSVVSGRPEAECVEILEDLSHRGLLFRATHGGVKHYHLLAEAHGIWEYCLIEHCTEGYESAEEAAEAGWNTGEATANYSVLHSLNWGADVIEHLYNSDTPFYYPVPPSTDVVAEGEITPYDDWRAILDRNTVFAVSPCQCRISHQATAQPDPGAHPVETCISLGEMAEYYIENGIGRQITRDEAVAVIERSIDAGMVIQSAYTKDSEIFCSCHGDCCDILASYVACGCIPGNSFNNISHYSLAVDTESCLKCGMCANQCPLYAVTMDEETGLPTVNAGLCIRCGQCARTCPVEARKLTLRSDFAEMPELPKTMLDDYNLKAQYRISLDKVC